MVGYQNEEDFPNVLESWENLLHPEDHKRVMEEIDPVLRDVTDTVDLSNGEELLYTVRKKKQIVTEIQEKQKRMINALGKRGIPATEDFKGHCGCILFDLDTIKAVDTSNNVHKIWNTYLRSYTK